MVPLIRVSGVLTYLLVATSAGTVWGQRRYGFQGVYVRTCHDEDGLLSKRTVRSLAAYLLTDRRSLYQ